MSYNKTIWEDHIVQRQRTYRLVNNEDGTITLIPAYGDVIQQGTPVDAARLNKMENGIEQVSERADELAEWQEELDAEEAVQTARTLLAQVQTALDDIQDAIASVPPEYQELVNRVTALEGRANVTLAEFKAYLGIE